MYWKKRLHLFAHPVLPFYVKGPVPCEGTLGEKNLFHLDSSLE